MPYVAVLLTAFLAVTVFGWHTNGTTAASGSGAPYGQSGRYFWCGQANQPSCPADDPGWISVKSEAPVDIMAAMSGHSMFASVQSHYGHLAFDLPVIVHPFEAYGGSDYFLDDHWVAAVRNDVGNECGLFDFVFDRTHMRIKFTSYGVLQPSDPRYGHVFPRVRGDSARVQLWRERHMTPMTNIASTLVFFAQDHKQLSLSNTRTWTGGGGSPMDPMWLIMGSNGVEYLVGADLHTYLARDLPMETLQQ